ncbi:ribosomal protein S6 kinase and related protein [Spathaspora passalidarum NRRL Y-27907]|uniref:Ribosomal protein S6 kinase and related protein n=1 Tax=Spathaspora passalidarum (strain NRRL Y-27907 / 11-Y1) TaxID=619300 RepID=G3AT92_SPAPN|nr:ribosomal protein S6 kinase and related protein [Spathaspora passalidarum NRRL Y-27907]EGW30855.1 ribosomal protein S6 kinase and related protein [Spathaspora passalidarum NRRL Y-27907]
MAAVFDMEGYDVADGASTLANELNYKLIIHDESPDEFTPQSYFGENRSDPIPMSKQTRRRSSIASSYEVKIKHSYSSTNNGPNLHKPKLADFEPIKVLGKGSYGKVLLVRELSTGRLFAQKQLKKASLIINENTNEVNEKNYNRTVNEKNILEMVNHPNIVKLYYAFQDNNKVYLILEYLDGGELFHHLALERFMTEKNASYYIAQMVLALRYLHVNLKVIYRDLKPENCMLNSNGNLVLTDFGLSKVSSESKSHSMTGTAQYMAPEVLKGDEYDYSVDWWSLGCVAYDLLTGSPPYTGTNPTKILEKIKNSKKTLKFPFYLSVEAKDLLRKLLQVDPFKRINVDEDFKAFKQHRFFRHVNWDELENIENSESLPPILPIITDPILAENFDDEFTTLPMSPETNMIKDILHVKGFTYTNPSYLDQQYLNPKDL